MKQIEANDEKLSRKQDKFLIALMEHNSIADAAKAAGISRATAFRFLNDPVFTREFNLTKRKVFSEAILFLSKSATIAAKVLLKIAVDPKASITGRVSSSRAIIEWASRGIELTEIASNAQVLADELQRRKAKAS